MMAKFKKMKLRRPILKFANITLKKCKKLRRKISCTLQNK